MGKSNQPKGYKQNENKRETFIVKVDHHQSNTWQGRVVWADEKKTAHFRSALELLKLMEGAISEGSAFDELSEEDDASQQVL